MSPRQCLDSPSQEFACNTGDAGSTPESGRFPGGGYGNPFQCFCLENPMNRGESGGLQSMGLQRDGSLSDSIKTRTYKKARCIVVVTSSVTIIPISPKISEILISLCYS